MNGAFYVGAVGLRSQQRALDVTAGNIANASTPGFKRSQLRFSDVLATRSDPDVASASLAERTVAESGVAVEASPSVLVAGAIRTTGGGMDVAIDGQGFIELMGAGGQTLLWRGGTLKVGDDGLLAAANGLALKAAITVPDDADKLEIGRDGIVRAITGATSTEIGKIDLVRVGDAGSLEAVDGGLYRVVRGARVVDAQAGEDGAGMLVQGALEESNVEMSAEMVDMMMIQRAYAANAQIVQAADQLMAIANGLRK